MREQIDNNESAVQELLVYDSHEQCPYIPGQTARLPLRWPTDMLSRSRTDQFLDAGDRRSGQYLYHTKCPSCSACEPIRLVIREFEMSRSQKRVLKRGDRCLKIQIGRPVTDERRVQLYNQHKRQRGLDIRGVEICASDYHAFLVDTCCDTFELSFWMDDVLVGVAITDRGDRSLNAVYCYYDVAYSHLSLGTYSVLKHIQLCHEWEIEFLYLGLYVAESRPMRYKANYLPHQRMIGDQWQTFTRDD